MNPNLEPRSISVTAPITMALERVKIVLFRPFGLTRWFVFGFSAFLATLGESAGWGGGASGQGKQPGQVSFNEAWDQSMAYVNENLYWLIPVVVGGLLFGLAIVLLVLWLSSRGRFMFLDNVVTNQAEVVRPWRQFRGPANSLFWFRLGLFLLSFLIVAPFVGLGAYSIFGMVRREASTPGAIAVAALAFCVVLVLGLAFVVVCKLTKDFVVPLMWRRGSDWRTGWRELGGLLGAHFWWFILYLLFHLLINLVIAIFLLVVVLLTCCIAGCVMAIPYVGTIFLLPILVFLRSYSAYFLSQFGPEFDLFRDQPTTAPR